MGSFYEIVFGNNVHCQLNMFGVQAKGFAGWSKFVACYVARSFTYRLYRWDDKVDVCSMIPAVANMVILHTAVGE